MKTVGYSSGTGYLCQRDTLGRIRGIMGEQRQMSGLGLDLTSLIPGSDVAGGIIGAVFGTAGQLWLANKAATEATKQANVDASNALRAAGLQAQAQAAQVTVESQSTRNIMIGVGAVAALGLGAYLIYRWGK
jgi:hypothetical protein